MRILNQQIQASSEREDEEECDYEDEEDVDEDQEGTSNPKIKFHDQEK